MLLASLFVASLIAQPDSSPAPTPSPTPQSSPPPTTCPIVRAKLLATIDTKVVIAGATFDFSTLEPVTLNGKEIPAGTPGKGIVATLDHSKSHGESGYLVLEVRYLETADGTHVPVTFEPGGDGRSDAFVRAGSSDAPSVAGYIPYVGTAASIYDFFHHGKDAALVAGATFPLVVGDGMFSAACTVTPR